MQEQERTVVRRRPPTPEERERFRNAYEEEIACDPEILASAERCWAKDCRIPLAHLRSEGVFDIVAAVAALKAAREANGLTLEVIAAASGIGVETLTAVERGENKTPSPRTLQRYAAAVGKRFITHLVDLEVPADVRD